VRLLAVALVFCSLFTDAASAQDPLQGSLPSPIERQEPPFGRERPKDPNEEKMERDREKALNKQRQTNLEKDTTRLLQLATELKQYVDKSNEHTLSLDVIKKADEIEKLAKSVKEKMKGSY
jgi:hypothetical protein